MVLGWIGLAAVVAVSLLRKQRIGPVWLAALGYAVACQMPIYLMRSSAFTALELAQTLRYLPDLVVCWRCWRRWGSARRTGRIRLAGRLAAAHARWQSSLPLAFLASSLYSTRDVPDQLAGQPGTALSAERRRAAWRRRARRRRRRCSTRRSTR